MKLFSKSNNKKLKEENKNLTQKVKELEEQLSKEKNKEFKLLSYKEFKEKYSNEHISFEEYKQYISEIENRETSFSEYYDIYYAPYYSSYKLMKLGYEHPKLLMEFLYILQNFDFDEVKRYMKKTNWKWGIGKNEYFPSKEKMINAVIELIPDNDFILKEGEDNWIASGGFYLTLGYKNNVPYCELRFRDEII